MTNLTSLHSQMARAYSQAWRNLWPSDPPKIVRGGGNYFIVISASGAHRLSLEDLRSRIKGMRSWRTVA